MDRYCVLFVVLLVLKDQSTTTLSFLLDAAVQNDVVSCLEARIHCQRDSACRTTLDQLQVECDANVYTCSAERRQRCREVLTSIQTNEYFGPCTCDPSAIDADDCIHLQKTIFFHACVLHEGSHANVSWLSTGTRSNLSGIRRDVSDDNPDNEDNDEDGTSRSGSWYPGGGTHGGRNVEEESCIGIRRRCLIDTRCERHLSNYRNNCRENKKHNECIARDRKACYDAITSLNRIRPELFHCTCAMKKPDTRERCDRIQWRLANNTCLVTVPYVVQTVARPDQSYDKLRQSTYYINENLPTGSCIRAFSGCHGDVNCRSKLSAMLAACNAGDDIVGGPDVTTEVDDDDVDENEGDNEDEMMLWRSRCERDVCLRATRAFYSESAVWRHLAERMLFCTCDEHYRPEDVDQCDSVRASLTPSCARIELPPPTCLDLVRRCTDDLECGNRWNFFERHCPDSRPAGDGGQCPAGTNLRTCRDALLGLAGTELATNCTCAVADPGQRRLCVGLSRRLHSPNACKDAAAAEFITSLSASTSTVTSHPQSTTLSGYSADDAYHQSEDQQQHPDCLRHYSQKIPTFMSMPSVIRIYRNESSCSEICSCAKVDRKIVCRALPCGVNLSCKLRDVVYVHGASFILSSRGHCRCINGEIVCAKALVPTLHQQAGLFLHVGYSVVDQQVVETNSAVRLSAESVASKLGTLLNEDSAAQFCTVTVRNVVEGNLVFNINASKYNTRGGDISEDCVQPAKTLSYMINSRHSAVITDVELSIFKVSLLERVQLHEPNPLPVDAALTSPLSRATDPVIVNQHPVTVTSSRERKGAQPVMLSKANSVSAWRTIFSRERPMTVAMGNVFRLMSAFVATCWVVK